MSNANMTNNRKPWASRLVIAGALVGVLAGCHQPRDPNRVHGEVFAPEGTLRDTNKFMMAQAAAGARSDATLRKVHFDAGRLNSLGMAKLDLMLQDERVADPLIVYLDIAKDDAFRPDREDAVTAYLRDHGLSGAQVQLEQGFNPHNETAAALLNPAPPAQAAPAAGLDSEKFGEGLGKGLSKAGK